MPNIAGKIEMVDVNTGSLNIGEMWGISGLQGMARQVPFTKAFRNSA